MTGGARELKFRAWDYKQKRFGYIHVAPYGIGWPDKKWMDFEGRDRGVNISGVDTVEQYTGLRDKAGREIYEGDILLDLYHGQRERFRGPVVWQVGGFVVRYRNLKNKSWTELTCLAKPENLHWEVIGNIHENPELLEAK